MQPTAALEKAGTRRCDELAWEAVNRKHAPCVSWNWHPDKLRNISEYRIYAHLRSVEQNGMIERGLSSAAY
jgi:hypothetical protein